MPAKNHTLKATSVSKCCGRLLLVSRAALSGRRSRTNTSDLFKKGTHLNTYRLTAVQLWRTGRSLTGDALSDAVGGLVLRHLNQQADGSYSIDVQLDRPDHGQALSELREALGLFGLQLAEAYVTEWVDSWVEGVVLGALGGGAAIGAGTKNGTAALAGGLVGAITGLLLGRATPKVARVLQATWSHQRWYLAAVQPQQHVGWQPA
jgi:hypothetical protein